MVQGSLTSAQPSRRGLPHRRALQCQTRSYLASPYLLLTTYSSLEIALASPYYYLLLATYYYLLLTTHYYSLLTTYSSLKTADRLDITLAPHYYYLLLTTHYSLLTATQLRLHEHLPLFHHLIQELSSEGRALLPDLELRSKIDAFRGLMPRSSSQSHSQSSSSSMVHGTSKGESAPVWMRESTPSSGKFDLLEEKMQDALEQAWTQGSE